MYRVKVLIALLLAAVVIDASKEPNDATDVASQIGNIIGKTLQMVEQCGNKRITACLKERALIYLDNISGSIEITDGVTLRDTVAEKRETQNVSNPSLPEEPRARETAIDNLLMDRVTKFLSTHKLEFKIPKSTGLETGREIDADEGVEIMLGRKKKKKKKKLLMPILMLLKLKAIALLPLMLKAIALVSFKALTIGKIALIISSIIIIKKFLEGSHSSESYEFVAHPQHSHKHSSSFDYEHGPYRRQMIEDVHSLPYSAYANSQQVLFGNE